MNPEIRNCRCGSQPVRQTLVVATAQSKNKAYYFKCNECGLSSGHAYRQIIALRNWNTINKVMTERKNFTCRFDADVFYAMEEMVKDLCISKSQFVHDIINYIVAQGWTAEEYRKQMYDVDRLEG